VLEAPATFADALSDCRKSTVNAMRECLIGSPPAACPGGRLLWRRAGVLLRERMCGVLDPYRPERHYMRGPGPKCRERQAAEETDKCSG
jgi:hypothetical protein